MVVDSYMSQQGAAFDFDRRRSRRPRDIIRMGSDKRSGGRRGSSSRDVITIPHRIHESENHENGGAYWRTISVLVLIDFGATSNFISTSVARSTLLKYSLCKPFGVTLGTGAQKSMVREYVSRFDCPYKG